MSLSQLVTVAPGDRIQSQTWNNEFQNILTHPVDLISPSTGAINFNLQAHTGLLPSVVSATSATAGQALISTGGTTAVWGSPIVSVFTPTFTSAETGWTALSVVTIPHGLNAQPSQVRVTLRNIASTAGFSTGMEIPINGTVSEVNAARRSACYTVSSSAVFVSIGTTPPVVLDLLTAAEYQVSSSSWAIVARCWA